MSYATQLAVITGDGGDWPSEEGAGSSWPPFLGKKFQLENFLRAIRRKTIQEALETTAYNQSQAAKLLGVTPQSISKFLKAQRTNREN